MQVQEMESLITNIPDFPKTGVVFKDISPLLREKFPETIDALSALINWDNVDVVAGIESRGFILGAALAGRFNKGFIPIRKKGKLPPPTHAHSYDLEYGQDVLEIKDCGSKKRVVLIDDVLATGGTLAAAAILCEKACHEIVDMAVLIDLQFLNNFEWKGLKPKSLLQYQ